MGPHPEGESQASIFWFILGDRGRRSSRERSLQHRGCQARQSPVLKPLLRPSWPPQASICSYGGHQGPVPGAGLSVWPGGQLGDRDNEEM